MAPSLARPLRPPRAVVTLHSVGQLAPFPAALLAQPEEPHQRMHVGFAGVDLDHVEPERAEQALARARGGLALLAVGATHRGAAGVDQGVLAALEVAQLTRPTFGSSLSRGSAMQIGTRSCRWWTSRSGRS